MIRNYLMPSTIPMVISLVAGQLILFTQGIAAETFIVKDGEAQAKIVIAEDPSRTTRLAAEQLQKYIQKISGAQLPITDEQTSADRPRIYVGQNSFLKRKGVTAEGLKYGAFRMKSGDAWLALIGPDTEYTPREPWARHYGWRERVTKEWHERSGSTYWEDPIGTRMYRSYNKQMDLWEYDLHGSLNAVNQFLRDLGVRWYMPGELGEIVPEQETIALPQVGKVVRPDFPLRMSRQAYAVTPPENILWRMRIGLNYGAEIGGVGIQTAHEMRRLTRSEKLKRTHPEYFAVWGRRMNGERGKPCLSSEGFFREHVHFVRAVFDVYDPLMFSVMPPDGYAKMCECSRCEGKGTPERGYHGSMSDYVWSYVNRLAQEVYKTHPEKKLTCGAYSSYTLPPQTIDELSPNLVVGFTHGRGKHFDKPEVRKRKMAILEGWREKGAEVWTSEHYVFTHRGPYDGPVYFPHAISEGLKAIKGKSMGETLSLAIGPTGHRLHKPGFNHLNVYVTARLYWNADQDVDALLDEYYQKFYGPAAQQMKAFVDYCEQHWPDLNSRGSPAAGRKQAVIKKIDQALALIGAAQDAAASDSDYGKRIALVADYLQPLQNRRKQLSKGRENVPEARAGLRRGADITLDGRFDEEAWQDLRTYKLQDTETGAEVMTSTTFRMFWDGGRTDGSLYIGVRCEDPDMQNLNITATKDGNKSIYEGDNVEILLETQAHSYYQLTVNPAGALVDLDKAGGGNEWGWSSQARVAAHIGDAAWQIELEIPVTGTDKTGDPLHEVAGKKPREDYPWYFNIGRQRIRGDRTEYSAFAPKAGFHGVNEFGKLYVR